MFFNLRKIAKREIPAYMTVEASFIVPAATLIMAFIIYLSFYMYGRCILSQDIYLLGFRANAYYESQGYGSASEYIEDKKSTQFGNKYFGSSIPETSASASKDKVVLEGKITTNHRALGKYFKKIEKKWEFTQKAGIKKTDPKRKLRKLKRIKDMSELTVRKK